MTSVEIELEPLNEQPQETGDETVPSGGPVAASEDVANTEPVPRPDGGWGWLVVLGSFMNHVVIDGTAFSIGVIYVELIDYFGASTADTAWIGAIQYAMVNLAGPVAEALCKTFTPRAIGMIGTVIASAGFILSIFATQIWQLYITFGFLTGFGFGLKFLPSIVCVHEYFEKRQSLAMGIAVCGTGVGTFAFAPLSEYLIEIYGWQGALLIESAIILHGVAFSALFVPLEKKTREKREKEASLISKLKAAWKITKELIVEMMDFRLFKDPKFDVYCVCMFLFAVGYVVPMTYLPERAVKQGYSPREGAWLVSVLGILNMLGRIFVAGVGDRKCVSRFWMFTICIFISGVITGGSFLANYIYWFQMTYSGCYGFMIGIFISLESVVLRDLISIENLTKGYGLAIFVGYGIGSLVATPFTGWIFDVTQNYDNSFLVSGGLLVASALSMVLIPCLKRCDAKSGNSSQLTFDPDRPPY